MFKFDEFIKYCREISKYTPKNWDGNYESLIEHMAKHIEVARRLNKLKLNIINKWRYKLNE